MGKKLLVLLSVLLVSVASVFAASNHSSKNDSKVKFETQVGYSTDVIKFSIGNDSTFYKITQGSISVGEKVTLYTDSVVNFTTAATYNFAVNGEVSSKIIDNSVNVSDRDSDLYQNSLNCFIGVEKTFLIGEDLTANVAIGPNFIYFFNSNNYNSTSIFKYDSSYYAYGVEGIVNLNYKLTPSMKLTLGVNASYDPFCGGDMIDDIKETTGFFLSDYADNAYSINPTIGFIYSL